jgi:hypothetical protein
MGRLDNPIVPFSLFFVVVALTLLVVIGLGFDKDVYSCTRREHVDCLTNRRWLFTFLDYQLSSTDLCWLICYFGYFTDDLFVTSSISVLFTFLLALFICMIDEVYGERRRKGKLMLKQLQKRQKRIKT